MNENDKCTTSKKRRREKKEEVDPKKQQRLIKNRESAQASRERKKNYVRDLEGTVSNLTSNNRNLSTKVLSLEEENNRLREQLQKAMKGEKIEESQLPPSKKPKILNQKLPLPPMQSKKKKKLILFFFRHAFLTSWILVEYVSRWKCSTTTKYTTNTRWW